MIIKQHHFISIFGIELYYGVYMSSLVRLTAASLIEEQLPLELLAVRANTKRLNTVPEHPFGQILNFYFASEILACFGTS